MSQSNGPFIDGEFRAGAGERMTLVNPANEEQFAEVPAAGPDDVDRAVQGARRAFEQEWRDCRPGRRGEILHGIARSIRAHRDELAQLDMRSVGKPITDARDEVDLGARIFEYYAGAIGIFGGQTIPVAAGGFDFTLRQPMGVVAAIVPWNYPFPIACWKIAPALATGNTVILKPAQPSPLSALRLAQLANGEAGLPAGALQVLPGTGSQIGEALVTHPLVRKISFTGSTPVGSRIMQLAARDIKRISLELGGKSPNIVFADADLELATAKSPMSVFANAGQDCCARTRVFVERKAFDEFVHRFVSATCAIVVGDPADERTQVGPLVSAHQRKTVEEFLDSARSDQRRFVCGGGRSRERGFFLEPTVVLDCETSDRIWREEVFGPVVCIRPFDDEERMLREVNDSPYGLSGSLWTRDLDRALRVARRVESGVLSINSNSSVHVEAPFGGYKQSGLGRDLGLAAMEGYTELKNVYVG
jgi:betaine-aldehyde dehydrogenase